MECHSLKVLIALSSYALELRDMVLPFAHAIMGSIVGVPSKHMKSNAVQLPAAVIAEPEPESLTLQQDPQPTRSAFADKP